MMAMGCNGRNIFKSLPCLVYSQKKEFENVIAPERENSKTRSSHQSSAIKGRGSGSPYPGRNLFAGGIAIAWLANIGHNHPGKDVA